VYICEIEIHQVLGTTMMETFDLAVIYEICVRVHEIRGLVTSWVRFEERLKDEYFYEDPDRMTKRSFLDWVE
jgi:hypothetical protein